MSENQTVHMIAGESFVGNLGRDAELAFTPSGKGVFSMNVAVSFDYKDRESGEWVNRTAWYRVNAFEDLAEELNAMTNDLGEPLFSKSTRIRVLDPVFKITAYKNNNDEPTPSIDVTVKKRSQIEIVQRLKSEGNGSWGPPPVSDVDDIPF